jgi:DNA polymerase III epsilon subunit-like protein
MTTSESQDWRTLRLVVVDVEGNGQQPPDLVEVAIVALESGAIAGGAHEWLVRPETPITPIVSRLHGIKNDMVAGAPPFTDVAAAIREVLRDDYFVAHNAHVDLDVLSRSLPGWTPRGVIDTLRLAREFLPGRKSYSLTALAKDLGLAPVAFGHTPVVGDAKRPHRAAYDALVTANLFVALARNDAGEDEPRPLSALLNPTPTPTHLKRPSQGSLL